MSTKTLVAALLLLAPLAAAAHTGHKAEGKPAPISKEEHAWGRQGDPARAARTIEIDMNDTMRFTPAQVKVKRDVGARCGFSVSPLHS